MDADNKQALLEAVNVLITAPDAFALYESLDTLGPMATRHPVRLADGAAVLNPLLELRVQDKAAYDRVLELIDTRRKALGNDPLRKKQEATGFDKTKYQRQFMDQKRERQRVAVEIENMLRPPRDRLIGNHRLEFMRRESAKWKDLRDEYMAKLREANGGSLSKEQQTAGLEKFWKAIDADLEEKLAHAQRESLKPAAQRVPREMTLDSLNDALAFDPYKQ